MGTVRVNGTGRSGSSRCSCCFWDVKRFGRLELSASNAEGEEIAVTRHQGFA